jgi:hypothetical protein
MGKSDKIFWSYIAAGLVFTELCIDIFINAKPSHWEIVRMAFIILNVAIIMYLLNVKKKAEELKAQNA